MLVGVSSGCLLSRLNLPFKMSFILAICCTNFHFRVNSVHLNRGPTHTSPFFSLFPLSQSTCVSRLSPAGWLSLFICLIAPCPTWAQSGWSSSGVCCGWNIESTWLSALDGPSCGPTLCCAVVLPLPSEQKTDWPPQDSDARTHMNRATVASDLNFLETADDCWCPGKRTPECRIMTDLHKAMMLLHFRCPWLPRTDIVERTQIPESSRSGIDELCHDAEITLPIHDSVSLCVKWELSHVLPRNSYHVCAYAWYIH